MRRPYTDTAPLVAGLTCVLERTSEAMLVRAVGEVDLATVPILWSNLKAMREDNLNVIVDLKADPRHRFCGDACVTGRVSAVHSVRTTTGVSGAEPYGVHAS